jgi:CubicO group peptidase (beta-lactamase class C family)
MKNKILSVFTLVASLVNLSVFSADSETTCPNSSINVSKLKEGKEWIDRNDTNIHSFLVNYCGTTVMEDYYIGYDSIMPHDLQSATKTVSSMLIGVALKEGYIKSIDQPLSELLPNYSHLLTGDKADINLRQVLNMTTGLKWVDFQKGNSFDLIAAASDSVEFILAEPLLSKPGEKFAYNTGSSHLLSAVISVNTGMSALEYANKKLFTPLKMQDYEWDAFKDGTNLGGWGLYMRPRDMIKLGQLILDDGRWNGQQLIDESYIDEATRFQVSTDNGPGGSGYGFQMWITKAEGVDVVAAAMGYGGQIIYVLDKLDIVAVFTASVETPMQNLEHINHVFSAYVVPAYRE